jgi:hypothetical protein
MLAMEAMSTARPSASCINVLYQEDVSCIKNVLKMRESSESTYYKPTSADVLCGRGQMNIIHPGNRKLRACVGLYLDSYLNAKNRQAKTRLVDKLVNMVRESGGKFLKKESGDSGGWFDIGDKHAFEKVSHVFRDARAERIKNDDQDALTKNKGLFIKSSNLEIHAGRTRSDPPSFLHLDPTALMLKQFCDHQHETEQTIQRRQEPSTEWDNFSLRQQPQPPLYRYMHHIATDLRLLCRSPRPDPIISSENDQIINEIFVTPGPYDDHPSFTSSDVANDENFFPGHDFRMKKLRSSGGYQPTASDVLCGRGQTNVSHDGNQRFRASIGLHLDSYLAAKNRLGKTLLVAEIVKRVRESGGKFLKKDRKSGEWFDIGDKQACEKVGHALRDAHAERIRNHDAHGKQSQISSRTTATTAANATQTNIDSAPKDDPSALSMLLKQPLISVTCSLSSCHGCRNCLDEMGPLLSREDCLSPIGSFCTITTQDGGADSWTHRIPTFDELF